MSGISPNFFNSANLQNFLQKLSGVGDASSQASELESLVFPKEGEDKAQRSSEGSNKHVQLPLRGRTITLTPKKDVDDNIDLRVEIKTSSLAKATYVILSLITGGLFAIISLFWNAPRDYLWGKTWTQKFTNPTAIVVAQVAQAAVPNAATNSAFIMPGVDNSQAITLFNEIVADSEIRQNLIQDGFFAHFYLHVTDEQLREHLPADEYIVTNLTVSASSVFRFEFYCKNLTSNLIKLSVEYTNGKYSITRTNNVRFIQKETFHNLSSLHFYIKKASQ